MLLDNSPTDLPNRLCLTLTRCLVLFAFLTTNVNAQLKVPPTGRPHRERSLPAWTKCEQCWAALGESLLLLSVPPFDGVLRTRGMNERGI